MKKLSLNKIKISKLNQIRGGSDTLANADGADTVEVVTRNCETRDPNSDECNEHTNNSVKTGDIRDSHDCARG